MSNSEFAREVENTRNARLHAQREAQQQRDLESAEKQRQRELNNAASDDRKNKFFNAIVSFDGLQTEDLLSIQDAELSKKFLELVDKEILVKNRTRLEKPRPTAASKLLRLVTPDPTFYGYLVGRARPAYNENIILHISAKIIHSNFLHHTNHHAGRAV